MGDNDTVLSAVLYKDADRTVLYSPSICLFVCFPGTKRQLRVYSYILWGKRVTVLSAFWFGTSRFISSIHACNCRKISFVYRFYNWYAVYFVLETTK